MANAAEKVLTADELLAEFLKSDDNFSSFGFGSQAINQGFTGKVSGITFQEVSGPGVSKRADAQRLNTKAGSAILANEKEYSKAPALVFDNGARTITLNALVQHPESTISIDGAEPVSMMKLSGKQWGELVGYTLECTGADNDENRKIPRIKRYGAPGETEMRPTRKYEFTATK